MKQCRICEALKPPSEFSFDHARCKRCAAAVLRRRKWEQRLVDLNSLRPWAYDDDAKLLALLALGAPLEEIATLLERTPRGVESHLIRLRQSSYAPFIPNTRPRWTPARIAALHDLIAIKGYTRERAARRLGVTCRAAIGAALRHLPQLCRKRPARVGI